MDTPQVSGAPPITTLGTTVSYIATQDIEVGSRLAKTHWGDVGLLMVSTLSENDGRADVRSSVVFRYKFTPFLDDRFHEELPLSPLIPTLLGTREYKYFPVYGIT